MKTFLERITLWNDNMNGLPRKGMLIAITLLSTWLFVIAAPLCWPFLLAMLLSMMLRPLMRFFQSHTRHIRVPGWLATMLGMLLLLGVLGIALVFLINRLMHELTALVHATPSFVNWISTTLVPSLRDLYRQYSDVLPASVIDVINKSLSSLGDSALQAAGTLSATFTSGAVKSATAIPGVLLSVVLTIMGTFYMTYDHERILAFFRRTFPQNVQKHSVLLKNNLFRSLFGQIKSQLTVSFIIMTFLTLIFVLYGVKFGLLFGVLIGFADALPVIGAGLFLIPWSLVELALGRFGDAAFFAAAYIGTVLIRQIFEPRIVGANLGLYPLATMISMYAGFQLIGVFGLIVGPVLFNLLKVVLEADDAARGIYWAPLRPRGNRKIINSVFKPPQESSNASNDPANSAPAADAAGSSDGERIPEEPKE
jgi:sporulation integral membrane protein YtvI